VLGIELEAANLLRDGIMVAVTLASLALTPKVDRAANGFAWGPIAEVAKLFAGIFVAIIPVLAMLRAGEEGAFAPLVALVTGPDGRPNDAAYFWLTGGLSSFLDNAPTYLVFFELAGGDADRLMKAGASTLMAISAGAVFMGANSYIGNAPNFMVYAIARGAGVRMPSFFGYLLWSASCCCRCSRSRRGCSSFELRPPGRSEAKSRDLLGVSVLPHPRSIRRTVPALRASAGMTTVGLYAAIDICGAAARTSESTCGSKRRKFSRNIPTRAFAVSAKAALSCQVLTGYRMCGSTPGTEVGTAKPKYGSRR
jgi:hypothetical protein